MFFCSLAAIAFLIYSCSKTSDEVQSGNNPPPGNPGSCDTVNMHYQADVVPILSANCYSCHGTTTNSGSQGIILEGFENIKPRAENGKLIGAITHAEGFPQMPKDGPKLSDCNINKIKSWVNNGIQNN